MKKNKIGAMLYLFALFYTCISFSQTVTIDGTLVNGQQISNTGPINLGTTTTSSNITLSTVVTVPTAPSDTYPGTLKIYYKKNQSASAIIANGGDGGSLLFLGGTYAVRTFDITLLGTQFDATGGFLYVEYKTYAGSVYKSANISITKTSSGTNPNPGPNPNPGSTAYNQKIPFGGVPILPKLPISITDDTYAWVYNRNGIDEIYVGEPLFSGRNLQQKHTYKATDGLIYTSYSNPININITTPFTINTSVSYDYYSNISSSNIIGEDQYLLSGEIENPIIGTSSSVRRLSYLRKVYETIQVNNFKWQKRILKPLPTYLGYPAYMIDYDWKDIPLATQANYTPTNVTEVTEFRRLQVDQLPANYVDNLRTASSKIVTVYPLGNNNIINNSICCNQTVNSSTPIATIIGSTPTGISNYSYKWQLGTIRGTTINWNFIENATDKDYLPYFITGNSYYRRFVINNNDNKYYMSNSVNIFASSVRGKINSENNLNYSADENSIKISPNPSSNYINIESVNDISSYKIKVIDMSGRTVISKEPSLILNNSLQLDINELPTGIYNLLLENDLSTISRKVIKK